MENQIVKNEENRLFYDVNDVAYMLGVSKGHAYKIIKPLNDKLKQEGYIVVAGRIPKSFFAKYYYGLNSI